MANIAVPNTFSPNTLAKSADVDANFAEIQTKYNAGAVQTDVAKTITVAHTFGADILFTDALYDVGKSGATRPRDGFFSRNLGIGGSLTATNPAPTANQPVTIGTATTTGACFHQLANTGGGAYVGLENSAGGALFAGTLAYAMAIGHSAAKAVQFVTNNVVRLTLDSAGVLLLGTSVSTSAGAGEAVVANAKSLRGVNAAGTDTKPLIALNASDKVSIDSGAQGAVFGGSVTTNNLTVNGVPSGGVVAVAQTSDITNTTTTPANTSLAVTLGTSQTWKIDFDLMLSCNNTGGIVLNFTGPAGVSGAQMIMGPKGSATTYTSFAFGSFAGTSTWSTYDSSASPIYVRASCYVVTAGTAGAFTLQYCAGTSTQTAKVFTGSTLHATRIA